MRLGRKNEQEPWTIERVLNWTRGFFEEKGIEGGRFDAELLMADALQVDRMRLYLDHHKPLSQDELKAIRERVRRRGQREPVAYITGQKGFWSLDLAVDSRVLVPRPETEGLVERALEVIDADKRLRVVDVGCGSGCITLALATERPQIHITGVDISEDALAVARLNAQADALRWNLAKRLLQDVDGVDVVVSNPIYSIGRWLMDDVRLFEPRLALDGGPDGLEVYRALIPQAAQRLNPGGHLLLEIGYDQGPDVAHLCSQTGLFESVEVFQDLAGLDRVVRAQRAD